MAVKELDPVIKKEWEPFLEFIYTAHQLTRGLWHPCYQSILVWEEYKASKKKKVKWV